jgi:hypothetical protein
VFLLALVSSLIFTATQEAKVWLCLTQYSETKARICVGGRSHRQVLHVNSNDGCVRERI